MMCMFFLVSTGIKSRRHTVANQAPPLRSRGHRRTSLKVVETWRERTIKITHRSPGIRYYFLDIVTRRTNMGNRRKLIHAESDCVSMTGNIRVSRREILGALGTSSMVGIAGCDGGQSGQDSAQGNQTTSTSESNTRIFEGGDAEDFAAALDEIAANPGATLEFAPGTYRFEPAREQPGVKWWHFNPPMMEDVTIEGNGAKIIFREPAAGGIKFAGGSDITIRNLTFDYDPVPFTQGVIRDLSEDRQTVEVELDKEYPQLTHDLFNGISTPGGSIHTADGEFIQGIRQRGPLDTYYSDISKIGDRRYVMSVSERSSVVALQEGLKQLFKARRNIQVLHFYSTDRPTLENVTVHASNGAGFSFSNGKHPVVRNCVIAPPSASDRLIGTNADGIFVQNVESRPVVEDTRLAYVGDSPIVVQDTLAVVAEVIDDRTIRIGEWDIFAQPGDTLRALSQGGERMGTLPPIEAVEYRLDTEIGRGKAETITFESSISDILSKSDLVGSQALACHDFVIKNNTVRNVRGQLIRISASHGVVEGNTLEGAHRNGIEIECDTNDHTFIPKGGVTNVTVRNNDISRPGLNYRAGPSPSGIRVHHNTRDGVSTSGKPNRDITIEGNIISDGAYVGIEVDHAADVRIERNEMQDLNQLPYPETGNYGVVLNHVETGGVIGNVVRGSEENLSGFGVQRESNNIETSGNELVVDGESQRGRLLAFMPVRISFDQTVTPSGSNRFLAVRFFQISLHDADGGRIMETNIGADEKAFFPGDGVYSVAQKSGESWRWFGGESETATMYLYSHHLGKARTLRLEGEPIQEGITGTVSVDGQETDTVAFGQKERQVYEISLI